MNLICLGFGNVDAVHPLPPNVEVVGPEAGSRFWIVEQELVTGDEYDQWRFVSRRTANTLVELYPHQWRIV